TISSRWANVRRRTIQRVPTQASSSYASGSARHTPRAHANPSANTSTPVSSAVVELEVPDDRGRLVPRGPAGLGYQRQQGPRPVRPVTRDRLGGGRLRQHPPPRLLAAADPQPVRHR